MIYKRYKPLRNFMQGSNLELMLQDVWALSRHVCDSGALSLYDRNGAVNLKNHVFPWDVALVVREIVLHANSKGMHRMNSFKSIGKVINFIRDIENATAVERLEIDDIMSEIHRATHKQFPWRRGVDFLTLTRYLMIFGEKEVDNILMTSTGMGVREYFFMGFAVSGHLLKHPGINAAQDYTQFGIGREQTEKFFARLSISIEELRTRTVQHQKYDDGWSYTWNPLEATPLIACVADNPNLLYCPIPALLLKRISQGLFYDIVAAVGFDNAFGGAFQKYVGTVINHSLPTERFAYSDVEPYVVAGNTHHGVDWIVSDASANIFVECKTKRLRLDAKVLPFGAELTNEINILADAIVQTYKNIEEAEAGFSSWIPNDLPSYPLVVTLEDWYLFGEPVQSLLRDAVNLKLSETQISISLLERPYIVASCSEFEILMSVIDAEGISTVFNEKDDSKYFGWMLITYLKERFPNSVFNKMRDALLDEWRKIIPGAEFPTSAD